MCRPLSRRATVALGALVALVVRARGADAALGDCGQPITAGPVPVATDCLFILNVAVGLETCAPECVCAPKGSLPTVAADALACLIAASGGALQLECPCSGGACPDVVEIKSFARTGRACGEDSDCPVGTCDQALSRCVTATDFDFGWTGIGHDMDTNDSESLLVRLSCGDSAPCGTCEMNGIDPTNRSCRCVGDNRAICDEPFVADQDDCGGETCACYLGPPLPVSAGNTPSCIVNRLADDLSGTIDVDTGELAMTLQLRAIHHTGEELTRPCPYCENDVLAADGVRDGTCVLGPNAGLACDVDAMNWSFPAPAGGGHSLDCFPDNGKNHTGAGLIENFTLSTGTTSLTAAIDCTSFGAPATCHCGICSENPALACSADSDCAAAAAGTCEKKANLDPRPNQCDGSGACTAGPEGDGVCAEGPTDHACDGVVRADGEGFIACLANDDCDLGVLGVDAGDCTLAKPRECFLPTIDGQGTPDPETPVGAAIYCVPPTAGAGKNAVWGVVGPARIVSQMRITNLPRRMLREESPEHARR